MNGCSIDLYNSFSFGSLSTAQQNSAQRKNEDDVNPKHK